MKKKLFLVSAFAAITIGLHSCTDSGPAPSPWDANTVQRYRIQDDNDDNDDTYFFYYGGTRYYSTTAPAYIPRPIHSTQYNEYRSSGGSSRPSVRSSSSYSSSHSSFSGGGSTARGGFGSSGSSASS